VNTVTRELRPWLRPRRRNLVELLLQRERAAPDARAALHFVEGKLREVSWSRLLARVRAVSEGLVALGVAPGDRVAVFAPTRLDGCVADLAILGARAVTVPIAASSTAAEIEHVLRDSGARTVFVDGDVAEGGAPGRWSRLRDALERVAGVEHVVAFDLPGDPAARRRSLEELEARGRGVLGVRPCALEERSATIGPEDVASICYATGTTGVANGVVLTHGSWTAQAEAIPQVGLRAHEDVVLLFLPLAHTFGRVVQVAWLDQGFPLAFGRSPDTVLEDAAAVGATAIPAVPRLFEKVFARVVDEGGALPGPRGAVFRWGMREFDRYASARIAGRAADSLRWRLARRLVFSTIRARLQARLGGRMRGFVSGSAPLARRLSIFFEECGLPVLD
jgi:long-chain acyl-CoA synthetase